MQRGQVQYLQKYEVQKLCKGVSAFSRNIARKNQSSSQLVSQVSPIYYESKKWSLMDRRLPNNVPLELGALLEPMSVAIHASRRAQLPPQSTTLVFGAGAVGLLVSAIAKIEGSSTVVIADIDNGRVEFAVKNGFAHAGYTVPMRRGNTVDENLEIAKETAAAVGRLSRSDGAPVGEVDAAFECTGVPSCLQAAIYVWAHECCLFIKLTPSRLLALEVA
jgi:hypothetical protein